MELGQITLEHLYFLIYACALVGCFGHGYTAGYHV